MHVCVFVCVCIRRQCTVCVHLEDIYTTIVPCDPIHYYATLNIILRISILKAGAIVGHVHHEVFK